MKSGVLSNMLMIARPFCKAVRMKASSWNFSVSSRFSRSRKAFWRFWSSTSSRVQPLVIFGHMATINNCLGVRGGSSSSVSSGPGCSPISSSSSSPSCKMSRRQHQADFSIPSMYALISDKIHCVQSSRCSCCEPATTNTCHGNAASSGSVCVCQLATALQCWCLYASWAPRDVLHYSLEPTPCHRDIEAKQKVA